MVIKALLSDNGRFRETPVQSPGEVDAHAYALPPDRDGQFSDNVPLCALLVRFPMRILDFARPQSESVMVPGGRNDVPGADVLEELCPLIGIPLLHFLIAARNEIEIVELPPTVLDVMFP